MNKTKEWKSQRLLARRRRRAKNRLDSRRISRADEFMLSELERELVHDVRAPDTFLLENKFAHEKLCEFLHDLRLTCKTQDRIVRINFKETKKAYAGAMLLFYSELWRLQSIYPNTQWLCRPSKNNTVNQVLKYLGIFDRLGYSSSVEPQREDVVSWRHTTSTDVDGEKSGELLEMYKSLTRTETRHMFRGVAEATTNVVHHAYEDERRDGLAISEDQRWWMFCREQDEQLYVAVCDLGIGIPRSLPIKFGREVVDKMIESLGGTSTDGKMIRAAIELARTRTREKGRGKGLSDLKRVVDEVAGARLYIFSNSGLVEYWGGKQRVRNFKHSILGTLIVWALPLGDGNRGH